MKLIPKLTLLLLITLIGSCAKDEEISLNNSIEVSQNSNWNTEDFKTNYTIQFPDNYEGTGMVGFEGYVFNKSRIDKKVEFTYSFCNPLFCSDFGNPLNVPILNSLTIKDQDGNEIVLNSKKEFSLNGNLVGILYHNSAVNSIGKYYMNQGDKYLEGLTIYFSNTEYQEVENIIKTIAKN